MLPASDSGEFAERSRAFTAVLERAATPRVTAPAVAAQRGDLEGSNVARPAGLPHLRAVESGRPAASARRLRTIIADDNAAIRLLLSTILSPEPDFELVGEVGDGHAALTVAGRDGVDLLVLDLSMPGLDGLEVLERLAVSRPDLCIVVYTGITGEAVAARARALGARDVVLKGTAPEELVERLRAAASR